MLVFFDGLTYAQAFARLRELYPDLPHSQSFQAGVRAKSTSIPKPVYIKPLSSNATPPSTEWQTYAKKFLSDAQNCLWSEDGEPARQYLLQRGLTEETIRSAGYGFLPCKNGLDVFREPAHYWGLSVDEYPDGVYLPSGVLIPYFYKGDLWKLRIRRIGDTVPKNQRYSLVSGSSNGLYNADDIRPSQPVLVFEGEIDADSIKQAIAGKFQAACTATGSIEQARIPLWAAKLAVASIVLICFDNEADSEKIVNAIEYWKERLKNAREHRFPDGYKDGNDMLQMGVDIMQWLYEALPVEAPQPLQGLDDPPCDLQYKQRVMTPLGAGSVLTVQYFERLGRTRCSVLMDDWQPDRTKWAAFDASEVQSLEAPDVAQAAAV